MKKPPQHFQQSYDSVYRQLRVNSHGYFERFPEHATQRPSPRDHLLIWVVGGQGYATTQGMTCDARAGDLLTFRAGHAHAYGSHADAWNIYWMHFDGVMADAYISLLRGPTDHPWPHLGVHPAIQDRFEALLLTPARRSPGGEAPGSLVRSAGIAHDLLSHMIQILERSRSARVERPMDDFDPAPALRLMADHPDRPLTLAALARTCHLSPSQFSRRFHRHFGVSPMRYVIRRKMTHAASLLSETQIPVKQVALNCGYDDPYYFSRLFRQTMGQSPQKYRQQMRTR